MTTGEKLIITLIAFSVAATLLLAAGGIVANLDGGDLLNNAKTGKSTLRGFMNGTPEPQIDPAQAARATYDATMTSVPILIPYTSVP